MIARSVLPFTLRNFFERSRLASVLGYRLNHWRRRFAAFGDRDRTGRSEILLRDPPERFRRFCPDCGEDTAHEGFDELGVGWYAQISHCQRCGRQGMRVWSLA